MSANARLLLILVAVAVAATLLLGHWAFQPLPPGPTHAGREPMPTTREQLCGELAGRIRDTPDVFDRAILRAEYDRRCSGSPPPTSLDR